MPHSHLDPESSARREVPRDGPSAETGSYNAAASPTPPDDPAMALCPAVPPDLRDHPRYRVLELLGAGGMGCIYKARHRFMDRVVALKVIKHALLGQAAMVARFLQEVRAAARLCHPNIVRAYDADRAGDTHFLVMEFVEGVNLDRVLAERCRLAVAEACDCARQAALGLQHAHEFGLVHRDVKPHNLMRTPSGQVKILDFGLARFASEVAAPAWPDAQSPASPPADELTGSTTWHRGAGNGQPMTYPAGGTADYMAPEEILDPRRADIRADVYGLGCTLYRFLTGQVPFPGGRPIDKLRAHRERMPVPVDQVRPEVPVPLAEVVGRMMAKDPAARFQTPDEVAVALAPFAGTGRGRILVVDDDAAVRQAVGTSLEREGYTVTPAGNGREALRQMAGPPLPDLILLDLAMPVMDGWQFLQRLRSEPVWADIPVVILSAAERRRACSTPLAVVDYLQKPVPVDELARTVHHHTRPAQGPARERNREARG